MFFIYDLDLTLITYYISKIYLLIYTRYKWWKKYIYVYRWYFNVFRYQLISPRDLRIIPQSRKLNTNILYFHLKNNNQTLRTTSAKFTHALRPAEKIIYFFSTVHKSTGNRDFRQFRINFENPRTFDVASVKRKPETLPVH